MRNWVHVPGEPFMREAEDMPESQSVGKCAELRQGCRDAIFSHTNELHDRVMGKLGEMEKQIAYSTGQANGRHDTDSRPPVPPRQMRFSWREAAVTVAILATVILSLGAVLRGGMSHADLVKVVREVMAQEKKP